MIMTVATTQREQKQQEQKSRNNWRNNRNTRNNRNNSGIQRFINRAKFKETRQFLLLFFSFFFHPGFCEKECDTTVIKKPCTSSEAATREPALQGQLFCVMLLWSSLVGTFGRLLLEPDVRRLCLVGGHLDCVD